MKGEVCDKEWKSNDNDSDVVIEMKAVRVVTDSKYL